MNILKPIFKAYQKAELRNWDTIYWAIDLHDTVIKPSYDNDVDGEFYPYAKEVLRMLSNKKHIKLILYSCSYDEPMRIFIEEMKQEGIIFDFFNENPEAKDTTYGTYEKKLYFNIILEDKAGFEPEKDWEVIYNYLSRNIDDLERMYIK